MADRFPPRELRARVRELRARARAPQAAGAHVAHVAHVAQPARCRGFRPTGLGLAEAVGLEADWVGLQRL